MKTNHQNFLENLSKAYKIMAVVIKEHGSAYLPIFKRLHEELEIQRAKNELENTAFLVTNKFLEDQKN